MRSPWVQDIDLELRGRDIEQLGRAANDLTDTLASYGGLYDISNSYRSGKRELALKVLPEAEALGLTQRILEIRSEMRFMDARRNACTGP